MIVLITGATGFVGSKLTAFWISKGITVHYLTTNKEKIKKDPFYKGFYWNPSANEIDTAAFKGVSCIVNLAGTPISSSWNTSGKQKIMDSRLSSAATLHAFLSQHKHNITQVISASAVGIYPSDFHKVYREEESDINSSFLGEVCKAWETANKKYENLGIKSTILRFGLICDPDAGALKPFRLFVQNYLGACLGSGKQWYSWVHWKDVTAMIDFCFNGQLPGTYNCVAPKPLIQKEFLKQLAEKLGKPILLPAIPRFVLRLLMGEKQQLITDSQRVASKKIENKGFVFQFPTFNEALDDLFANN